MRFGSRFRALVVVPVLGEVKDTETCIAQPSNLVGQTVYVMPALRIVLAVLPSAAPNVR